MNRFLALFLVAALLTALPSCVSKKKYEAAVRKANRANTQKDEVARESRKLQDSLNAVRAQYAKYRADSETEYKRLKTGTDQTTADMKAEIASLKKKYDDLMNSSLSRQDLLSTELKNKKDELDILRRELDAKEQALAERETRVRELEALIRRKDSLSAALLNKVRDALRGFSADELTIETRNGKVYVSLSEQLLFPSGSAVVNNKGKQAIGKVCEVLNRNPDIEIMIEGHTDNIPISTAQFKDNWDLSVIRATSIVRIMTKDYSVEPVRVVPSGRSEYVPVAPNTAADGRAKNRRTEIILSPKLDELMNLLQGTQP
jgi:chemotaxis protein MotB